MKCFKLIDGDCVIENNDIALEYDTDVIASKIKQVLSTNLGEWEFDENEGIDFHAVLTKNPNYDLIKDYVKSAIMQVDDTLELTEFECITKGRALTINIKIETANGEQIAVATTL